MTNLDRYRSDRHRQSAMWLEDFDLKAAVRCIVAAWFARFERAGGQMHNSLAPQEFGMLEPYLAEATVVDHGADFAFSTWGAALGTLCGGSHFGDRLSSLPQPSRSHLRRVCVRAAASRSPAMSRATWALDGEIWRCVLLALPTGGDDLSVKHVLLALLFAPHPAFADEAAPEGFGWPPAILKGSVHGIGGSETANPPHPKSTLRMAALAFRRLLTGNVMR